MWREGTMAGRYLVSLVLTEAETAALVSLAGRRKTAQALALRARIILACAEGLQNKDVAVRLGIQAITVGKWRRYIQFENSGSGAGPIASTKRYLSLKNARLRFPNWMRFKRQL